MRHRAVLVRRDRVPVEARQQFGDAVERLHLGGVVRREVVVEFDPEPRALVGDEMTEGHGLRGDAAAHERVDQRAIRIEQRAVEVEDNRLRHSSWWIRNDDRRLRPR
jgi:hypothetical protein